MGSGVEERDITVASIEERCPTAAACVLAAGESAVVCVCVCECVVRTGRR